MFPWWWTGTTCPWSAPLCQPAGLPPVPWSGPAGRSWWCSALPHTTTDYIRIHLTDNFTSPKVTRNPTRQCLCHTTEEPRFYFLNNVFEWFPRFCMLFWKFLRPSPINKLFVLKNRSVFVLYLTKRLTIIILPYYLTTFFVVSNMNFLKAIIQ